MHFFALLLCSGLVTLAAGHSTLRNAESVVVSAPTGRIRGSFNTTRLGRRIYSFRGVRYAEPPTGERRFKPPVPAVPWNDVFDATQEGPTCPQPGVQLQSEDCLRLNVYTTKLPGQTKSGKVTSPNRPVMVFFHPGAFYVYTAQSTTVGPQYLLDQDVVLVSVEYRMGSLGMVATGDAHAPGNLALKDQVAALRWVRDNIASFGGDPNSVTITGHSAGAWSVILHMLSPMTKGLFHRAIAMSGSPIYQTALPYDQMDVARRQANVMGCPSDTSENIINCLKTKDAIELAASLPKLFEWHGDPVILFSPVVEPEVPGVERYLTDHPTKLIQEGKLHDVPFLIGVTKDEFSGVVIGVVVDAREGNFSVFDDFNENWERIAPISFSFERGTEHSKEISRSLKQFYFHGQPIGLENYQSLGRLYGDALVAFNAHRCVTLMGRYSEKPVYYYELSYQGRYSHAVWPATKKPYGVVHHDDLLYVFYDSKFPYFETTDPEYQTVKRVTSMWANFAKTGEPVPRDNPMFTNVEWPRYTSDNRRYMQIGDELTVKSNLGENRMQEWDGLFPIPTPPGTKGHH